MKPGLYLAHKPVGPVSFSLVREWTERSIADGSKLPVSHGGTLDPFASGLLVLLVGQATRLIDHLHSAPKTYVAEIAWGAETDNGDPLGSVVATGDASGLTADAIASATAPMLGWTEQVPPATSAKKIAGEPAYKKAHRGEEVVLPPSRVYLHEARWISHALPSRSTVELTCRGGFYVRSFARDLGRSLGVPAHVAALRRSQLGPWRDPGEGRVTPISGRALLPWCPSRDLTDAELGAVKSGGTIVRGEVNPPEFAVPQGFPDPAGPVRAFHRDVLVALLRLEGERLHPATNLRGGL